MISSKMTTFEYRAAFSLASLYAFRMLGLFMILPVFALYAGDFTGATPALIGIAMGIYGLTQALLQIPFGMLSDRFGRKPVIALGLAIFAIGSLVAAFSDSITGIIIGRALQGAGAIGSSLMAMLADLTEEEHRSKAMAIVGLIIGVSFSVALLCGPLINSWFGLSGIFGFTTILGIIGILALYTIVPKPTQSQFHKDTEFDAGQLKTILKDRELLRLDLGIFSLHAILTASFVVIPITLQTAGVAENAQWTLYLPILVCAFLAMLPFIIIAEKNQRMKSVFLGAISLILLSQLMLAFSHQSLLVIGFCLFVFLTAFSLLEACLPSLIAKQAPANNKGTAMGVYSFSQFMGIFIGGSLGGWLYGKHSIVGVFLLCALFALMWLSVAFTMKRPRQRRRTSEIPA